MPRLLTALSMVPERWARTLHPVAAANIIPTRPLVARPGFSCLLGDLRESRPSPSLDFPSASEYLHRF